MSLLLEICNGCKVARIFFSILLFHFEIFLLSLIYQKMSVMNFKQETLDTHIQMRERKNQAQAQKSLCCILMY
jgi:hypothetical protein